MVEDIDREDFKNIVELVRTKYGYDFSDYATSSLKRRFIRFMRQANIKTAATLNEHLAKDALLFQSLLESITVNVTEMFRDPQFYKDMRHKVLNVLSTYPSIKIWHAGCATGEEVFSMAILLHEAGLLERSRLYATDLNKVNLAKAAEGIIPLSYMKDYTNNYLLSGGKHEFADYYTARYDYAIINKNLRKNIIFSQHNLVTDQVFNEFQLVCCRNVLIYFNKPLQNKVLQLFHDSLSPLGYLAIGSKESLTFTDQKNQFDTISSTGKIFRRKA